MNPLETAIRRARMGKKLVPRGVVSSELDIAMSRAAARAVEQARAYAPKDSNVLSHQMLASFIVGQSNRMAYDAVMQIVAGGKVEGGLLVIYGGPGVGKTHLVKAAAGAINEDARRSAIYVNVSRDTEFDLPRQADVVIIDNVHSCSKCLCAAVNDAIDSGRTVIAVSDAHPNQLRGCNARTRSRLEGGVSIEIAPFDDDVMREYMERRLKSATEMHAPFVLSDDIVEYISAHVARNGRAIDGTINSLVARSKYNSGIVTMDMVERAIVLGDGRGQRVSLISIIDAVARHYGMTRNDLLSRRRTASVVMPRHIAMYLAKALTQMSLPEIGRRLGGRDHTTVLHGVRKIERMIADDARLAADVDAIKNRITRMS